MTQSLHPSGPSMPPPAQRPMAHPLTPSVLPPGLRAAEFARALDGLRSLVGSANVRSGDELTEYLDPYAFVDTALHAPAAAVCPASVEEVQAVVQLANDRRLPIWTVSRGRNYAYGGASPRVAGSVVLDLHRMNRVLEVDEELGYALVEPGVSFSDLHDHLRRTGSALWTSVPDLSWGSVVGNALERGFGYTAHGDHSAQICGLEVVLADGTLLRTGMGAMTGNGAWAAYKGGFGPSLDGLFLQSNYGVVTKMGVWLQPAPETAVIFGVQGQSEGDLAVLMDTLRPLLMDGTIEGNAMIGHVLAAASMMTERKRWYDGPGAMPEDAIRAVRDALGLGWWNARGGIYGPAEVTQARLGVVRTCFEQVGIEVEARTYPGRSLPDQVHPADQSKLGLPGTHMVRMAAWRGGDPAHTDFSLVCPPQGEHALAQVRLIRQQVEQHGFDYAGGFTTFPRHAIALALISFDRSDDAERASVAELFGKLVQKAAEQGYAPYRSHLAFMDTIASQFDFNEHAAGRLQQTIKDAVDPNGILSAGKQGIWPRRTPRQAVRASTSS